MKSALAQIAMAAAAVAVLAVWIPRAVAEPTPTTLSFDGRHMREVGYGQIRFDGRGPEAWAWLARASDRQADRLEQRVAQLKRELRREHRGDSIRALRLAAIAYNVDAGTLIRKADCETGGTFSPFAANPRSSARGLMQFLTRGRQRTPWGGVTYEGTWGTTPYADFSWYDRHASALAAAWMHARGRGSEWSCR